MTMPKKTKKQKIIAAYRNRLQQLQASKLIEKTIINSKNLTERIEDNEVLTPKININYVISSPTGSDKITSQYFFSDLKKSLLIIVFIIALEFVLYFATINNYLSRLIKF